MNLMLKNIFAIVALSLNLFASDKISQVSNREVLYKLCDEIVGLIVKEHELEVKSISLKMYDDSLSLFLRQQFIQSLFSRNIQVSLEPGSTETTLEIDVQESSVFYSEVFTESFLGERKTERTISMTISSLVISNTDRKILSAKTFLRSSADTVVYSTVNQSHDNSIPFSSYQAPTLSFFDVLLEPMIVTIASGVAIYLFFTIRS